MKAELWRDWLLSPAASRRDYGVCRCSQTAITQPESQFDVGCSMFDVRCSCFRKPNVEHSTSNVEHRTKNEAFSSLLILEIRRCRPMLTNGVQNDAVHRARRAERRSGNDNNALPHI